jgi:hypothetical protein
MKIRINPSTGLLELVGSSGGGGAVAWGAITGTLSDQTDLQTALNAKQDALTFPLDISQGGTNSNSALLNERIMLSLATE